MSSAVWRCCQSCINSCLWPTCNWKTPVPAARSGASRSNSGTQRSSSSSIRQGRRLILRPDTARLATVEGSPPRISSSVAPGVCIAYSRVTSAWRTWETVCWVPGLTANQHSYSSTAWKVDDVRQAAPSTVPDRCLMVPCPFSRGGSLKDTSPLHKSIREIRIVLQIRIGLQNRTLLRIRTVLTVRNVLLPRTYLELYRI